MLALLDRIDWDSVISQLFTATVQVIFILILLAVGNRLLRHVLSPAVKRAVRAQMVGKPEIEAQKRAETITSVIYHTLWIALLTAALLVLLSTVIGLNVAPLIAGIGVGGLAFGLGAQSLVRDAINGLFILSENQYAKGDIIRVGTITGVVEELNLRRTVVRDLDGAVHSIPNGEIRIATNLTRDWSGVHFHVAIVFGEDIERAMAIINRVGQELASDPAYRPYIVEVPRADRIEALDEKGVAIKVLGVVTPGCQWQVMSELRRRIVQAFVEERIEVPYPLASTLKTEAPKPE